MPRIEDIGAFNAIREAGLAKLLPPIPRIGIGMGTCGRANGAEGVYHAFAERYTSAYLEEDICAGCDSAPIPGCRAKPRGVHCAGQSPGR